MSYCHDPNAISQGRFDGGLRGAARNVAMSNKLPRGIHFNAINGGDTGPQHKA